MPHRDLNFHAITVGIAILGAEVSFDLGDIGSVIQVHLASLHVLELWMVDQLLADNLTTNEEDSLNFEARLITKHANFAEGVLSEAFESLDEAL